MTTYGESIVRALGKVVTNGGARPELHPGNLGWNLADDFGIPYNPGELRRQCELLMDEGFIYDDREEKREKVKDKSRLDERGTAKNDKIRLIERGMEEFYRLTAVPTE